MRAVVRVWAATLMLVALTACGGQSGPANQQRNDPGPRPEALRVELDAQMRDPCFRRPQRMDPPDCKKYITQLASTPEAVSKLAEDNPALAEAAGQLRKGIGAYRSNACASTSRGKDQACGQALANIAEAIATIHDSLETGTSSR